MKTREQILDVNGFDFEAFKYENEYSAKNLLLAMKEYAELYHESEVKKLNIPAVISLLPDANPHICAECSWQCTCSDQPCSCCSGNDL